MKFYPRDIGRWRDQFTFNVERRPFVEFNNEEELFDWLESYRVPRNDPKYPLRIDESGAVIQWTVIGWWSK